MRPQDQSDICDLLAAYGGNLDLEFIRAEMDSFTTADDARRGWFENCVRQASRLPGVDPTAGERRGTDARSPAALSFSRSTVAPQSGEQKLNHHGAYDAKMKSCQGSGQGRLAHFPLAS